MLAHVLPDGRAATLWQDTDRTAESLAAFDPADAQAWRELTGQWERIGDLVVDALLRPFPPVRPALRLVRRLGLADTLRMARLAVQPVRRFGLETFAGEGGPVLLAGNALHSDVPPDSAGSAVFGWLLTMLGASHGFPVPVGGADQLVAALSRRLESLGGEIRLSSPVASIDVRGGRATGVVLASGERIDARQAVLADVTAPQLFGELVGPDRLPPRFVDDLDKFQWDTPTMKINWALQQPIPWTAADAAQAGTVHLGVDLNGFTDYSADLTTGRIPRNPFVLVGQMTTADATRSPAGTESAWAYTHVPPGEHVDAAAIEAHVRVVEELLERHAPGFGATVLGRSVQSPADLAAHDANLFGGAINGGTAQLHQQLVFRPVPGLGGAATPIDRLYLAGSSAHPGGGVHGACGSNAAFAALARGTARGRAGHLAQARLLKRIYHGSSTRPSGMSRG